MRRVLVVSHSTPCFPGAGAEARAYSLMSELSEHFDVTFLLPDQGETNRSKLKALAAIGQVLTYPVDHQWRPLEWRIRRTLRGLESTRRYWPLLRQPQMVHEINWLNMALRNRLRTFDWTSVDLLHLIHPHTALALNQVKVDVPRTLDWVDERKIMLWRNLEYAGSRRARLATMLEIDRIQRFQASIASLFDITFVASDIDADRLVSSTGGLRPIVVPNGVDVAYFVNRETNRPVGNTLIFTGHMSYEPNVDAVIFFCNEVLPIVARQIPDTRVLIVGMQPHPDVQALAYAHPGVVTVTGEVADVRPYLVRSAVSIVPLRSGGGTRLKILEAMAMQRPVVSTPIGCEGLAVEDGRHLLVRVDPLDFARGVVTLLTDESAWHGIVTEGRILVEQKHSWKVIASTMADTWRSLLESPRQQGGSILA